MKRKMKPVLIVIVITSLLILILVSFLYIRGTLHMLQEKKEAESTVRETAQTALSSQDVTQAETETEVEEETEAETETEQDSELKEGYHLCNDTVWTTDMVDLKENDDEHSGVICQIDSKTQLNRIAESDEWAFVEYQGQQGYVLQVDVSLEEPRDNGHIVVIDPGHQTKGNNEKEPNGPGSSTMKAKVTGGTQGKTTGVYEYQLNLDIAKKLEQELKDRGYRIYMTRTTNDVDISNAERAKYAESVGGEILVRIHANGADNSSVSGAMALAPSLKNPYVSNIASDSQLLSQCILDSYCENTGMKNQGVVKSDTMTGINWCTMPVTIIEMGYMTNRNDDVNMEDASFQDKMVLGMADGIDDYFEQIQ